MKLTKRDLVEALYVSIPFDVSRVQCVKAVDILIMTMFDKLVDRHPIRIQGVGKLICYNKPGGREVRNPKTGETMTMPSRVVTSFIIASNRASTQRLDKATLSMWSLIALLADELILRQTLTEDYTGAMALKFAELTLRAFNELIIKARKECATIEIRGFGTFKSKTRNVSSVRNPSTGEFEKANKDKYIRTVFKESLALKTALNSVAVCA